MEYSELLKLLVSAVVGVLTKEFFSYMLPKLKSKDVWRPLFNKQFFSVLVDVLMIPLAVWQLLLMVNNPAPVTRVAVLGIAGWLILLIFFVIAFLIDLVLYIVFIHKQKRKMAAEDIPESALG